MMPKTAGKGTKSYLVFVSHHRDDAWVARQIAREIRSCGANAFLSEELEGGQDFADAIRRALRNANELVALLTPWAFDSPFVIAEIGPAWAFRRRIVPLLHGAAAERRFQSDKTPIFLKNCDFVRLKEADGSYFSELRRRVRKGKRKT